MPCIIEVQGDDSAVEEARKLTHEVMSGRRLEPAPGVVGVGAYFGAPLAPPYALPPYAPRGAGGVEYVGGLAQYSRAARLENEKTSKASGGAPGAAAQGGVPAGPGSPGRSPQQQHFPYPRGAVHPAAYGMPPYAYAGAYGPAPGYAAHYGVPAFGYAPHGQAAGMVPGAFVGAPPPPPFQPGSPESWTSHVDAQGHQYWYNAATGQSTWDAPPGPRSP